MIDVRVIVEQHKGIVAWKKDVTPADPAFHKKRATWRASFRFDVLPETAAEYREWCHENARLREPLIARVMGMGYVVKVGSASGGLGYTGSAYAQWWPMPDAGLEVRLDAPNPTEAMLRVSWVVEMVARFDLNRLRDAAAPATWDDPWA